MEKLNSETDTVQLHTDSQDSLPSLSSVDSQDDVLIADDEPTLSLKPTNRIFTIPNLISFVRLLTIPVIAFLVLNHKLVEALALLAVSALTDALDGYAARTLNQITKLGQILDPIADRALIFFSVLALGFSGVLPWWLLIIVGLRDAVLAVQILVLAQYDYGPLPVHFVGKTATAMIMLDIPVLVISQIGHGPFFELLHAGGYALAFWGVAFYWIAGFLYLKQAYELIHARKAQQQMQGGSHE